MPDSTGTESEPDRGRRSRRRAFLITGAALSGLALAAGSAALASASWTDRTWFAAEATTGSADLQGSIDDGETWADSDDAGAIELVIPALDDLRPGDSTTTAIRVRNTGSLEVSLEGTVAVSGALFSGPDPVTAALTGLPASVAGGASVGATLTITAPDWTGFAHQGETGSVRVSIVGTVE